MDQLVYRRERARLAQLGAPQVELARVLGITQPTLSGAFKRARDVPQPRPGFSGAMSYEICQRYSVGELTREQVLDELKRWEYVVPEPVQHDCLDDLRFETPGSFDDVARAYDDGLIDNEIHDAVLDHIAGKAE